MKRMPNLELSPIAMKMLIQNRFNEGAEAIICRSGHAGTLYKIFKNPETRGIYDAFGIPTTIEFFRMSENKKKNKQCYIIWN